MRSFYSIQFLILPPPGPVGVAVRGVRPGVFGDRQAQFPPHRPAATPPEGDAAADSHHPRGQQE